MIPKRLHPLRVRSAKRMVVLDYSQPEFDYLELDMHHKASSVRMKRSPEDAANEALVDSSTELVDRSS
jgi:hypothetical protein